METCWESVCWFLSSTITSGENYLHVESLQSVDRRPKFNFGSINDFLCDLREMVASYPRDIRKELAF